MTQSILNSTKKLLGIDESLEVFDVDIIIHINSVFGTLHQLGVGTKDPFFIEDAQAEWSNFIEERRTINSVKSYMYLKVRLLFDPPQTGPTTGALEKQAEQLEWRLLVAAESEALNDQNEEPDTEPLWVGGPPPGIQGSVGRNPGGTEAVWDLGDEVGSPSGTTNS